MGANGGRDAVSAKSSFFRGGSQWLSKFKSINQEMAT